jgi:NADH:ubiquinone oxidoreductase subunit 6 (subunit J)
LLTDHVLAFELVSVLLLAALVGALSLMRGGGEQ